MECNLEENMRRVLLLPSALQGVHAKKWQE